MKKKHEIIWYNILQIVKNTISVISFNTWFKPINPVKFEKNILTIQVPSGFFYEYLEEHYIDLLKKIMRQEIGTDVKLKYQIVINNSKNKSRGKDKKQTKLNSKVPNPYVSPGIKKTHINPNLNGINTFENFIEGNCNRLGRAAGKAIGQKPGNTAFNPILIYGEPGMGKTHLAQAIGIEVKNNFKERKNVLYVPANQFQTQYTNAARKNSRNDFLYFYQMIDVLIVDDVHEFAGKPGTQDTFFHIFNHLHQAKKQLVLTSDRSPTDLKGLNKRLISRFKWGLLTELTNPEHKTRIAILKQKAHNESIKINNKIINYIAENILGSARELEGAIISLIAHSTFVKNEIDFIFAKRIIDKLTQKPNKDISMQLIQNIVCEYFAVGFNAIQSKSRKREIVQARQIAMYFAKKYTNASLVTIGKKIGNKDHTTVLYAAKTVNNLAEINKSYKELLTEIDRRILYAK